MYIANSALSTFQSDRFTGSLCSRSGVFILIVQMVRRRKVAVDAYNKASEDGETPLRIATVTYDHAPEERVRETVVPGDRVQKTVVHDKASEDGVLVPLETVVDACDKAAEEGVSFETFVDAYDKVPVNRARKTVGDAYGKSPEDELLVPFETVVDAFDKAPVDRVWESVGDAYDKTPEDSVLNPLRAVDDAYDNASEEDRKRIRVILVMGLTGTGKSTFIKTLTNDRSIIIGDDLHSRKQLHFQEKLDKC